MNVRKAFLYDAEKGGLQFLRKPIETCAHLQVHVDTTARREAVGIPAQSRWESRFIKKWGMQQVRHRPKLSTHLIVDFYTLTHQRSGLIPRYFDKGFVQSNLHRREHLPGAVVQFTREPASFFVLKSEKLHAEFANLFVPLRQFFRSFLHSQFKFVVRFVGGRGFESRRPRILLSAAKCAGINKAR